MNIKEALTSTVAFKLPENRIEKALIDNDLIGTADYTKVNEKAVDLAMIGLLFTLITAGDEREDDVSLSLPGKDVLLKAASALYNKWGLKDPFAIPGPTIRRIEGW